MACRLGELSGQPAPLPLSHVDPDLIQEVNVQSPVAVTLSEFSFSFLKHRALSFHRHPTHASPLPPCYCLALASSPVILRPLLPLCPASLPECPQGSTCCPLGGPHRGGGRPWGPEGLCPSSDKQPSWALVLLPAELGTHSSHSSLPG